jgi:hypothetical protein
MKRTLISHFYNEEYLLPWFCKHHAPMFDHGIMVDYGSTDRSVEIIRELCPNWEIRPSRNEYCLSPDVEDEIMDIERDIDGWRICLNTTEFLTGNYDVLDQHAANGTPQMLIQSITFLDTKKNRSFDPELPLHEQIKFGAWWADSPHIRNCRSIHNYAVKYSAGKHWWSSDKAVMFNDMVLQRFANPDTEELIIFYYGWAPFNDTAIERKISMGVKFPEGAHYGRHHVTDRKTLIHRAATEIMPHCRDLTTEVDRYITAQNSSRRAGEPVPALVPNGTIIASTATPYNLSQDINTAITS